MSFFDKIYNKLFSDRKNQLLSHQTLNKSDKEMQHFEKWLAEGQHQDLMKKIYRAYHLKLTDNTDEIPIVMFRSKYANGFAIKNNDEILNKHFPFIMEYFKMKIVEMDYRQAGSDKKVQSVEDYVLTIEKYYLKPPMQVEPPIDQLYGNIALELHYFNDIPNYLKLTASIYSDRMYKPHLDFAEMVERLFDC